MSFKFNLICVSAIALLTACGGGGSSSTPADSVFADTTAPSISITPSSLIVAAGESLDFEVAATDDAGFGSTTVTCDQGSLATTMGISTAISKTVSAGFGAPATEGLISGVAANSSAQLVDISVTVGTAIGSNATRYDSVDTGGFVVAIVDENGVYHFSTEADISLERTIDIEGGVPNAPDSFNLEMNNVFDFQD